VTSICGSAHAFAPHGGLRGRRPHGWLAVSQSSRSPNVSAFSTRGTANPSEDFLRAGLALRYRLLSRLPEVRVELARRPLNPTCRQPPHLIAHCSILTCRSTARPRTNLWARTRGRRCVEPALRSTLWPRSSTVGRRSGPSCSAVRAVPSRASRQRRSRGGCVCRACRACVSRSWRRWWRAGRWRLRLSGGLRTPELPLDCLTRLPHRCHVGMALCGRARNAALPAER
jgi:hypothetical protein